jgi:hypothetical protein
MIRNAALMSLALLTLSAPGRDVQAIPTTAVDTFMSVALAGPLARVGHGQGAPPATLPAQGGGCRINGNGASNALPPCTSTPSVTATSTPSGTFTSTPTPTGTPTLTPTSTRTPTPTSTSTDTPSSTPTATPTETPSGTPTSTATSTPVATSTCTPATYVEEVLTDHPVAWWRFGELSGVLALDATGNGHTGQYLFTPILGAPGAIVYDPDTAVTFNASQWQYVSIDDPNNAAYNVPSISVELWLKTTSSTNLGMISRRSNSSGMAQYRMRLANGVVGWQVQTFSGGGCPYTGFLQDIAAVNDGTYHHVVGTYDSGTQTLLLFVDGTPRAAGSVAGTSLCPIGMYAALVIAEDFNAAFDGTLDEVAIYGSALPPGRVAAHYRSATSP